MFAETFTRGVMPPHEPFLRLLLNAELYDPAPRGRRHLLVAGARVAWVGADAPTLPAALGIVVDDLGGRRVIPGLIDAHVHVTGGGGEAGFQSRVPRLGVDRFTVGGTTTVVGVLGTDDCIHSTTELVATARGLAAEGLSAWCWTGGYHLPLRTATGSVRRDMVLVSEILGVGELAIADHRSSAPTRDELLRVASEAHVGGLMTGKAGVVHLHVGDGGQGLALVREALDAGPLPPRVFQPTHVNRRTALFAEALDLAARGCVIDVTAFPVAEGEDAYPAAEAVVRYRDAGLPPERLTVSSDAGGSLPVFDAEGRVTALDVGRPSALGDTLRELLARGIALEEALPPFTANVARHLRLERKGRLAAGADADLVVLDDDGRPRDVMARGRWHVRDGQVRVRGTFDSFQRDERS